MSRAWPAQLDASYTSSDVHPLRHADHQQAEGVTSPTGHGAKCQGFVCQWIAPGEDGPLFARRETLEYRALPVTERVTGDALTVLCTVLSDWSTGRPGWTSDTRVRVLPSVLTLLAVLATRS